MVEALQDQGVPTFIPVWQHTGKGSTSTQRLDVVRIIMRLLRKLHDLCTLSLCFVLLSKVSRPFLVCVHREQMEIFHQHL